MTESRTFIPKSKKTDKNEDLSKNHKKEIRYRLRIQKDKESKEEIKEWLHGQNRAD